MNLKKNFKEKVSEALKSRVTDDNRKVIIGAEDEGRFGRMNGVRRCWCPHNIRALVPQQLIREYFYVYAFVCPELETMISLILPYSNIEMMKMFLQEVSNRLSDYFIIMQVDRASWHTSPNLNIPENIKLIPQPVGSPEVNPAEHIWKDVRENDLCNIGFDSIEREQDV